MPGICIQKSNINKNPKPLTPPTMRKYAIFLSIHTVDERMNSRNKTIDIVRGLGILGVLTMHVISGGGGSCLSQIKIFFILRRSCNSLFYSRRGNNQVKKNYRNTPSINL